MSSAATSNRLPNRGPSRGGISKRGGGGRTDRDGDLSMAGASAPTGPKVISRGGSLRGRGGNSSSTQPRRAVSGSGSGAMRTKTPRDPIGHVKGAIIGGFVEMRITGWKESKGNDKECVVFLERKTGQKFRKARTVGDKILVQVPLIRVPDLLEWDNVQFASAHLRIAPVTELPSSLQLPTKTEAERSAGAIQAGKVLEEVLKTRYNAESKMLNLGNLIEDPILQGQGFFVSASTTTKLFPALMKVADMQFKNATEKREMVHSITLESNALADLTMVTTLAQTFPELKNLSLSGNRFQDWKDLDAWRWKFRKLEQLVLIGCPITATTGYRDEARKRYPTLVMLDNETYPTPPIVPVTVGRETRNSAKLPPAPMVQLPVAVMPGVWGGGDIVTKFLSEFFPGYDTDRKAVIAQYYDEDSLFSLAVNTSAPRNPGIETSASTWEDYIQKSRNMVRMTTVTALSRRLYRGTKDIAGIWNFLPKTVHDSSDATKWCYDTWTVPVGSVQGLWIVVHGEFEEVEKVKKAKGPVKRSFDRTFILAPRSNGDPKVINDMMTLRVWGGSDAWKPEDSSQQQQTNIPTSVQASVPPTQAILPPAEPTDEIKKQMLVELMKRTNLTESYALMCLNQTGWNFDSAMGAFQQVQASGGLPQDAFLP